MRVRHNALESRAAELASIANIVGELGQEPLVREQRPKVERILATFHREPHVRSAVFFNTQGVPFATYDRDGVSPARVPVHASLARSAVSEQHMTHALGLAAGGLWIARDVTDIHSATLAAARSLILAGVSIMALAWLWVRIRNQRSRPAPSEPSLCPNPPALQSASPPEGTLESTLESIPSLAKDPKSGAEHSEPSRCVLIVDDNALNQRVTSALLQSQGQACEVASNGQEALDVIAKTPIALVLMDCNMPVMDGWEATQRIRAAELHTGEHLPVIAMTAGGNQADRDRCKRAGMDEFVAKPIKPSELEQALERWLPARSSAHCGETT